MPETEFRMVDILRTGRIALEKPGSGAFKRPEQGHIVAKEWPLGTKAEPRLTISVQRRHTMVVADANIRPDWMESL
jgi:hypothetical protein